MKQFFSVFFLFFFVSGLSLGQDLGIPGLDYNANATGLQVQHQETNNDVLTTLSWSSLAASTHAVSRSCCAYVTIGGNDFIYQFGGGSGAQYTTVAKYDVAANTWTTAGLAPIPSAMSSASAVTIGNLIYLFGGENTAGLGKTLAYDPVANTWTTKANMPTLVTDALVVKFDDNYVYVIGGGTGLFGTGYFNSVQLYDVAANTYTACTPYPITAGMMGGGMLNYTIISAGGWDGVAAIANAYQGVVNPSDMTQITWTPIADYPATATTRMASFPIVGSAAYPTAAGVFFTGGAVGGSAVTGLTYFYNICTPAWETLTPNLSLARSNMKACGKMNVEAFVIAGYTGTAGTGVSDKATLSAIVGSCYTPIGGGGDIFTDNFDSYIAGQQLACQNPTDWTTWSLLPCSAEDAYVSTNYAYSGANSTVIVQNNDLIKPLGDKTSGKWYMSFVFYITAGKSGYFNQLTGFTPNTIEWGCDAYFDLGGGGRLDITGGGGGGTVVPFTWVVGAWNQVVLIVDLDSPTHDAQFWIGTSPSTLTLVSTWDWTNGGTKVNRIAANDFFGATANDQMYFDNYYFGDAMPPIIPVELTSFTGNVNNLGQVVLNWQTATELNNQGFEIERRTESSEFRTIAFVEGAGTVTETRNYNYIDKTADQGINYYRLKQVDFDGTYAYSNTVEVDVTAPLSFNLDQNYPNPFNPSTNIKFSVPESGNVKLSVYNLVGEEVAVLVNGFSQAGTFEVTFDASNLSTGVYLYKLQSANSVQTKKMMLLK